MRAKHILALAILMIIMLLPACNWNALSSEFEEKEPVGSSEAVILFRGDPPRNVTSTQAIYSDQVVVSFDGVSGADSYDIERVSMPSSAESYDENDWRVIASITADSSSRYIYHDYEAVSPDTVYFYRVKGRSLYAEVSGGITSKYSSVVSGWPLSPPTTLTASQGISVDKITLEWTQVDMVSGYNIYYYVPSAGGVETWTKYNKTPVPAPYGVDRISYNFIPTQNQKGVDVFFYVESISRGGNYSDRSGVRNGYTYVEGAPDKPEDLYASQADSSSYIEISWAIPDNEGSDEDESYFRWEISRMSGNTDAELIFQFNSNAVEGTQISEEDGRYIYKDVSSSDNVLHTGVDYTYTVRAILVRPHEEDELTGTSDSATGFLVGPPTAIGDMVTVFPDGSTNGYFEFTIEEPPRGWDSSKHWVYNIYGRKSLPGQLPGPWILITEESNKPVTASPVKIHVDYDPNAVTRAGIGYNVNEFDVRVRVDGEEIESEGVESVTDEPIVTPRADAPSAELISVSRNRWSGDLKANSNGVYPVIFSLGSSTLYEEYQVEALDSAGISKGTLDGLKNNTPETILTNLSPSTPGEIWYYRVRGVDVFGRYSEWSTSRSDESERYAEGYGALTGNAFIKFFEAYVLKPWEFVNSPTFPQNLKTKWNKSKIHSLVDKHGLGSLGEVTETSDFHNGTIYYHSYANGLAGDVDFKYTNFGELDCICGNGAYKMSKVNASGNNGTCSGTITVTGIYPATVDFSSLRVMSYAFSGNYKLTQDNGRGLEEVEAIRNE